MSSMTIEEVATAPRMKAADRRELGGGGSGRLHPALLDERPDFGRLSCERDLTAQSVHGLFRRRGRGEHRVPAAALEVVALLLERRHLRQCVGALRARHRAHAPLFAALVAPAPLVAAPSKVHTDAQNDFIMSDGRICNPRWGCNAPDVGTEVSVLP